jgi:hypothetical protein
LFNNVAGEIIYLKKNKRMKKIFPILFFASIIINSCKKEALDTNYSELIGEWKCLAIIQGSSISFADYSGFNHTLAFEGDGNYRIQDKQGGKKMEKGRITKISKDAICGQPSYSCKKLTMKNCFQGKKYLDGGYEWLVYTDSLTNEIRLGITGHTNFYNEKFGEYRPHNDDQVIYVKVK